MQCRLESKQGVCSVSEVLPTWRRSAARACHWSILHLCKAGSRELLEPSWSDPISMVLVFASSVQKENFALPCYRCCLKDVPCRVLAAGLFNPEDRGIAELVLQESRSQRHLQLER